MAKKPNLSETDLAAAAAAAALANIKTASQNEREGSSRPEGDEFESHNSPEAPFRDLELDVELNRKPAPDIN